MRKLIIDKTAIKQNLTILKEKADHSAIYGVLSTDGSGVGIVELARMLRDEGVSRFAVREVRDAAELRGAGFVDEEILVLTSTTRREEIEKLIDLNVVCTVSSVDTGLALNAVAENRSTVVEAHIQVDTGMGFGGFLVGEPEKILLAYRSLPNVALAGIYTQILAAPQKKTVEEQIAQFRQVIDNVHVAGFETGIVHAASSYTLLNCDFTRLDAVRVGSAILGRCRGSEGSDLRVVGYGEVEISECRWLPKGHTVGAGRPVVLKKPTRVAVIPVGYQHGFGVERPREAGIRAFFARWRRGRKNHVRIGGQRAIILGQIGAEDIIVDVTNLKCTAGDLATFNIDPMFARGFVREYR